MAAGGRPAGDHRWVLGYSYLLPTAANCACCSLPEYDLLALLPAAVLEQLMDFVICRYIDGSGGAVLAGLWPVLIYRVEHMSR